MTKFGAKTRTYAGTALASFALSLAPAAFSAADMAKAAETQRAESGGIYFMPRGDFVAKSGPKIRNAGLRRSATSEAELIRLKGLSGRAAAPNAADASGDGGVSARRAVLANCLTNAGTGNAPSDIHGAVAPTNLIVVTNVNIGVFNKTTCATVSNIALKTFFGSSFSIPAAETLFDPRALYDRLSSRCIVTAESRNSGNTDQFLYIAASTTSSCTAWRRIRFVLSRVSPVALFCKEVASDFYDYPNAGYNVRRLVVTSNNFRTNNTAYGTIMSIDKNALYSGAAVNASCFRSNLPTNLAPAVVGDSNTQMFILSPGSGGGNSLAQRRLNTSASGPGSDTLSTLASIPITAWSAPPDATQPNLQKLDTLDGRFQSATKQIGSLLWNVHAVNISSQSRARLYKISTASNSVLFTRSFSTTACTGTQHTFNPSVDTNSTSTSAPAFVTLSRTCPSAGATGRAAHLIHRGPNSANPWVFNTVSISAGQFSILGGSAGNLPCNTTGTNFRGSCRWGDYSSTQIDPSNTAQAWGFNQLITTGSIGGAGSQFNWNTRGARVN